MPRPKSNARCASVSPAEPRAAARRRLRMVDVAVGGALILLLSSGAAWAQRRAAWDSPLRAPPPPDPELVRSPVYDLALIDPAAISVDEVIAFSASSLSSCDGSLAAMRPCLAAMATFHGGALVRLARSPVRVSFSNRVQNLAGQVRDPGKLAELAVLARSAGVRSATLTQRACSLAENDDDPLPLLDAVARVDPQATCVAPARTAAKTRLGSGHRLALLAALGLLAPLVVGGLAVVLRHRRLRRLVATADGAAGDGGGAAPRCHFCGEPGVEQACCAAVAARCEVGRDKQGGRTRIEFALRGAPVPRCRRCAGRHGFLRSTGRTVLLALSAATLWVAAVHPERWTRELSLGGGLTLVGFGLLVSCCLGYAAKLVAARAVTPAHHHRYSDYTGAVTVAALRASGFTVYHYDARPDAWVHTQRRGVSRWLATATPEIVAATLLFLAVMALLVVMRTRGT